MPLALKFSMISSDCSSRFSFQIPEVQGSNSVKDGVESAKSSSLRSFDMERGTFSL
jgi:hypothetical protein